MATITRGKTFGATEEVTAAKLHQLVDSATLSSLVNADVDAAASIVDTKLATISTAGKVDGGAVTGLANIPSGAGELPIANHPLSSQAQAEEGAVNTVLMTPLRVAQAISALGGQYKVLASTRDMTAASGNVAYTGVGFTPKLIICFAGVNTTATNMMSWGFCSGTGATDAYAMFYNTTTGGHRSDGDVLVVVAESSTLAQQAKLSSFDADGFTLAWTKVSTPSAGTAQLIFLCAG